MCTMCANPVLLGLYLKAKALLGTLYPISTMCVCVAHLNAESKTLQSSWQRNDTCEQLLDSVKNRNETRGEDRVHWCILFRHSLFQDSFEPHVSWTPCCHAHTQRWAYSYTPRCSNFELENVRSGHGHQIRLGPPPESEGKHTGSEEE